MRGRHHPGKGEVAHRARGGAVTVESGHAHRPHNAMKVATGEGAKAPINAVKRARGGSCWFCGGRVHHHKRGGAIKKRDDGGSVTKDSPPQTGDGSGVKAGATPTGNIHQDSYGQWHGFKSGGGIHIKPSHKGLLHKNLHVAAGHKIPAKALTKAKHSSDPAVRKRAVFAANAKKWHH